jgi:hypothetical protein
MKQKIITGRWDGQDIWRWETAEETLKRELRVDGVDIEKIANLFIRLNENQTDEIPQTRE